MATHVYLANCSSVYIEPTCTEDGGYLYTAFAPEGSGLADQTWEEPIPALGHEDNGGLVSFEPTCTENGVITHNCSRCGEELSEDYIPALGHEDNGGSVSFEPTCTENGVITHNCSRCGEELSEDYIPALGHIDNGGSVSFEPTCTEDGVITHNCSRCGEELSEDYIPALGHLINNYHKEPTCTEEGVNEDYCSRCGEVFVDEIIPPLGHNWDYVHPTWAWTWEEVVSATATFTCKNDLSHTESVVATVTQDGISYIAAAEFNGSYCYDTQMTPVAYIDANGGEQKCTNYTVITDATSELSDGWYVVNSDLVLKSITSDGADVNIILMDEKELNVDDVAVYGVWEGPGGVEPDPEDYVTVGGLSIYTQSTNGKPGHLNITNRLVLWGSFNLYGGVVDIDLKEFDYGDGSFTFGWTNPADEFHVWPYENPDFYEFYDLPIFQIKESQFFYNSDLIGFGIYSYNDFDDHDPVLELYPCLVLANGIDNAQTISKWNGARFGVSFADRTFYRDGNWNTLCLPINVDKIQYSPFRGATVMELDVAGTYDGHQTGVEDGTLYLYFKNATSIEAGKPYIVKWANGTNIEAPLCLGTINADASTIVSVGTGDSKVSFIGTYGSVDLPKDDQSNLFLGDGNKLYWPNVDDYSINAFRAYFHIGEDGVAAPIRRTVLNFGDDDATIVENLRNETLSEGTFFDLSGRQVEGIPTEKGIYIINGHKVIVK